jgi:hypothetical protein
VPEVAACSKEHGGDPCGPIGLAALVAGQAGMGAVDAGVLGFAVTAWLDHLLRQADRPELVQNTTGVPAVLAVISATTVGRCWAAVAQTTQ